MGYSAYQTVEAQNKQQFDLDVAAAIADGWDILGPPSFLPLDPSYRIGMGKGSPNGALVGATSASPTTGIGYSTGAGIALSQATNKATTVSGTGMCGTITMNAAALNTLTAVSFTLTNPSIAAGDTVLVSHKSGGTAGAYLAGACAMAAGSCKITLFNASGGSLSEAVVLNFAVVKAVAA
jgi:hypothetical protein